MRRVRAWWVQLRHERVQVHGWGLALGFSLILAADLDPGDTPEVVAGVLAHPVNQQVLLFVDHVVTPVLAHLGVGRELDGVGGAGILAEAAEDAAGKIDAKPLRIAAAAGVFGGLQGDAIDGASGGTEVTGDAALAAVGIAGEDDAPAIAGGEVGLLLRILDGDALGEGVEEDVPDGAKNAEHGYLGSRASGSAGLGLSGRACARTSGGRSEAALGRAPFDATTIAPVTSKFASASGSMIFQPQVMS